MRRRILAQGRLLRMGKARRKRRRVLPQLRARKYVFNNPTKRRRKVNQMKKYRHRWSYDPQAQKKAQLSPLTLAIIIQGAVGTLVVWAIICLAWLAF
jgi:hypothetical protein